MLAKGDLEHEYGVPWKSITWVVNNEETIPFQLPEGVKVERVQAGKRVHHLLLEGQIDAAVLPHPPSDLIANRQGVRRVFADPRQAEMAYLRKNGYWPIMHLVAIRQDVVERYAWLPRALLDAFQRAKEKVLWHWEDPNWSVLAWGRHYLEAEQEVFRGDPWPYGLVRNRANIERFMRYSEEQGLIGGSLSVESLFHESVLDT